jgi:hypothetical protein
MKYLIAICFVLFQISIINAQSIKGKILDTKHEPIVGANVILLSYADSSFVAGTTTNETGTFSISTNTDKGILQISYLGYKTVTQVFSGHNVGTIGMEENSKILGEVVITGNRIINHANGYYLSLKGTGLENTNTPQEMLSFLPGITIDQDKILLLNKAPIVYVNGFKITSQEELAALLPKRIDKIEVDYFSIGEGATEKGGVIHITTKKENTGGVNGYFRENLTVMPKYGLIGDSPTFVIDANTGKCTFNYYAIYTHQKLLEDATNNYRYDSGFLSNSTNRTRSWMNKFGNRLNVSYEINDRSSLALSSYIGNGDIKNNQHNSVEEFMNNELPASSFETTLHGPESKFVNQTVGKYSLTTDELGSKLEIVGDYLFQNYHFNQFEDKDGVQLVENGTKETTNMYHASSKYSKKYKDGKELDMGGNYQYIHYNDITSGLENTLNAHSTSLFLNYSGRIKMIMYSAGLTLQRNSMEVLTSGNKTQFNDTYLCPQANFMWMINPQKGMMLAVMYQRGVASMPYSAINGYKNFSTPNHYTTGNSSLRTPSDHQLMMRLSLNRNVTVMFLYDRIADDIYYEHGIDENNITWSKPYNADYNQVMGARVEFTHTPTKWWKTKVQCAAMQNRFSSLEETISGKISGKFWWNNNFNFTPTLGGSLNFYWETGTSFENYSWRPVGNVNGSLWKTFCKDKLRLSLESTICAKGRKTMTFGDGYVSTYHNTTNSSMFSLSLTWNFSKGKQKQKYLDASSTQKYDKYEEKNK